MKQLFARISEASPMPPVARNIAQLTGDRSGDTDDLLRAAEDDPTLAKRVLRQLHSSSRAARNTVTDFQSVVTLLGPSKIRNLALTVYVSDLFRVDGTYLFYTRERLWSHLVRVAATAEMVSRVSGRGKPSDAYLGGLLHDIGYILMDEHLRQRFCRVIEQVDESISTLDVERELLKFDHAELGEFVVREWGFPEPVATAVRYHHEPKKHSGAYSETALVVTLANYFCCRAGFTSLGLHNVPPPTHEVYVGLGLTQEVLSAICEKLSPTLDAVHLGSVG